MHQLVVKGCMRWFVPTCSKGKCPSEPACSAFSSSARRKAPSFNGDGLSRLSLACSQDKGMCKFVFAV